MKVAIAAALFLCAAPVFAETPADVLQRLEDARAQDAERIKTDAQRLEEQHRRHWKVYCSKNGLTCIEVAYKGWKKSADGAWYAARQRAIDERFSAPSPYMRLYATPQLNASARRFSDSINALARLGIINPKEMAELNEGIAVNCAKLMVTEKTRFGSWEAWSRPIANSAQEAVLIDRCSTEGE